MTLRPFRVLWPSLRAHRTDLVIAVLAAVGAQMVAIPLPLLTRWIVHRLSIDTVGTDMSQDVFRGAVWTFAAIVAGLALLRGVFRWQQGMRGERLAQRVVADLRVRMFGHLQELSQGYFDRRPTGKILIRFVGDANALRTWLAKTVITVPAELLTILGVALAVAAITPQLLLAAALPLIAILPAQLWINPRARAWTREGRRKQSHLCGVLGERISTMKVIKSVGAQCVSAAEVQSLLEQTAQANIHRGRLDAWSHSISATAALTSVGAVGLWGVGLVHGGLLNEADLLAAVWLTLLLRGPVTRLGGANVVHQRARVAAERIASLLEHPSERGWSPALLPWSGAVRFIRLRRVGYKHPTGHWVFRGLSTTITGPGLVAVTDEADRAASMLLELLLRLRRPHHGRIELDEADVRTLHVADIRRRIGWVDRERRVADVVKMTPGSEPRWTDEHCRAVWGSTEGIAPEVPFERYRATLHNMDSESRKTDGLTREERLRMAVCSALLNDPPILLLDDPTSELPAEDVGRLTEWLIGVSQVRLVIVATNDARIVQCSSQTIHLPRTGRAVSYDLARIDASDDVLAGPVLGKT